MLRTRLSLGVVAAIALACGSETERAVAPQPPDSAVMADAQQQIAEREYHAMAVRT